MGTGTGPGPGTQEVMHRMVAQQNRFMAAYGALARLLDSNVVVPSGREGVGAGWELPAQEDEPGAAVLRFRLTPGDIVIFDNRRLLHGRESFDPQAGERLLHGLYLDSDMLLSRARGLESSGRLSAAGDASGVQDDSEDGK